MADSPEDNLTFEQALSELERIVHELEDGAIGLEDSLARYEKGVGLLKRCYGQLRQAEQRIQLLTGVDDEDQPIARPFEHSATVEAEKPKSRKKPETPDLPF
ncbi:MAG: exodeoxyribonuclease VII small subunit [Gemmataceae bacterium]|nr:exodeoxyribonuclease VII small subunit [Gemmataceae bacterium]